MIATSDSTVLAVMSSDARMGRSTAIALGTPRARTWLPNARPNATKISTGTPTVPNTPSGSRTNILVSSQVSLQSPRSIRVSVPNHVAGQLEEHVLEGRNLRAEVEHRHPVFRQALDHVGHEIAP